MITAQQSSDGARAIAEDAIQLSSDQRQRERTCRLEWQPILHTVRHARTVFARGKRVPMYPAAVRSVDLFVDKLIVWLPPSDPGAPVKGYSEEPQTIGDDRALFNNDWDRRQDLKSELRRRDAFKVFSIGEKCKHHVNCQRQNRHRFQKLMTFLHGAVPYDRFIVAHFV